MQLPTLKSTPILSKSRAILLDALDVLDVLIAPQRRQP
jgi:hypothetical protein